MDSNELFRMVSLRRSKSQPEAGAAPPADARLRHGDWIEGQARVDLGQRTAHLNRLKTRHVEVTKTIRDLEAVQRAVVQVVMAEQQKPPPPARPAQPTRAAGAARRASRTATAAATSAAAAAAAASAETLATRGVLVNNAVKSGIEALLTEREVKVFRNALARGPGGAVHANDLIDGLELDAFLDEGNKLCAQITAIEESLMEETPTVSSVPGGDGHPVVSAVGWGDLVVARETLVGYNAREIAHIENVLPGESKIREHQRTSKTEQIDESEVITERETEKDSQTTDRYELHAQAQETIQRDFSVRAGVNTSGRYGVTKVDASLDTAFAQSQSQSRSTSVDTAKEIVAKSVERTFERVRKLRRLTLTEEIKEFNRHELVNAGRTPLEGISGMYLWVEKIQKVELRHYGTRLMVEFHVPEPAVSLLESMGASAKKRRLPPFTIGPTDVDVTNYLCLAQRYGAVEVQPPPTQYVNVGYGWVSTLNEEAENWAEDQFTDVINVPEGYRPEWARVAWSGLKGTNENREFNFAFAVGGVSEPPATKEHVATTWNGVVLQLPTGTTWPQGVPVSGRVRGSWDGAMYVQVTLTCRRTSEAFDKWRIETWAALRAGYELMTRELAQEEQARLFQGPLPTASWEEGPAELNRQVEREELQKWAIKSLRRVPQNLNAIERVGDFQELSPLHAEAEAPVVRFYEGAFEWEHMSYFLYPYHWARRATWRLRSTTTPVDPRYRAFLRAGAARVVVPVTPGFEAKVAWYLDPANPATNELERILQPPPDAAPPSSSSDTFRDLWVELLMDHRPDMARGSGTLRVENGSAQVRVNPQPDPQTQWRVSAERDRGRELFIAGDRYEIAAVTNETTFALDRPYAAATDESAVYVAGSTPFGPPWTVNVPTSLIVLSDNVAKLRQLT